MLIEAMKQLKVKLATGEVHLIPGVPVEFPPEQAERLLVKAHGKVRMVQPVRPDWLSAWRELAEISSGLTVEDIHLQPVLNALAVCDLAFVQDDWAKFQRAKAGVLNAMKRDIQPGDAENH